LYSTSPFLFITLKCTKEYDPYTSVFGSKEGKEKFAKEKEAEKVEA